jgi:FdhD protein
VRTYAEGQVVAQRSDLLATEEPMETRLTWPGGGQTIAVTMRTPGADFELAAGFLFGEGIVTNAEEVARITYCVDPAVDSEQRYNIVNVELARAPGDRLRGLERHFFTSSACGVCGKAGIESLSLRCPGPIAAGEPVVDAAVIRDLPGKLRSGQGLFEATGGLHAAGLFTPEGELVALREDVGRHNALDKVVGWALLARRLPLQRAVLLVSGRTSYEILQKAVAAGIPVVCAISAPSSLAVDVAREFGVTLVGFLREGRFNVYTAPERIRGA